ncbi:MAG: PEP-CTERM sorting domain-containing protein [Phycisphaeraceae bacterium]
MLAITGTSALGSVTNGSFETGNLDGWESTGLTAAVDDSVDITPTDGIYQALMETNQGGFIGVAQMPALADDVEDFLGLSVGMLDDLTPEEPTQGSAIRQSLNLNAGEFITFDWNFLTDEGFESEFNDFAIVTLVNMTTSAVVLADTFNPDLPGGSSSNYFAETGYESFALPAVATTDEYLLGFAVLDATDFSVSSALLIDDVQVVPEPTTLGMVGLLAAATLMRRQRPAATV